ncbi:MAG: hypothetical protein QOE69_465 [Thermoleophilaceae bacterium]|nr:hypothetical protein [Thermoleophilaceae bacterium]
MRGALVALAAVRVVVPLAALAASGSKLPLLPRYDYVATTGDGSGFYAATREFLASWGRLGAPLVALLGVATVVVAALLVREWRRRRARRAYVLAGAALAFALLICAAVSQMNESGAAVFGWPLLWSLPMLPYRALGGPLDAGVAFGFGLVLSLVANVVTVGATYFVGVYATGRRAVGLAAAALFALWPLLTGVIAGSSAWQNGTWTVDAGLVMYTEPLSTALLTTALALLLSPRGTPMRMAVAGVALSFATAVKLTDGLLVALGLVVVALRRRAVAPYLAGAVSFLPLVAVYWPLGYASLFDNPNSWPRDPFSGSYVLSSWTDSLLFTPRLLLILLPLAALGALLLRDRRESGILVAWALLPAAFYSFYRVTWEHPRFIFASLPPVFVLWAVGTLGAVDRVRAGIHSAHPPATERT